MKRIILALTALTIGLAACSPPTPTAPPPTPTPTPDQWLDRAADAAQAMTSAQFTLTREGAEAILDPSTGITFSEATGKYQAPDRVSASAKVTLFGNVVEVQMLFLPEGNFITNPLTQTFQAMPAEVKLDAAAMFAPEGLPQALRDGIQNATLVGPETVEEKSTLHLKGDADGAQLATLTAGGLTTQTSYPVDVWIDPATADLVRVRVTEPDGNAWRVDVFAIGEPVEIEAP